MIERIVSLLDLDHEIPATAPRLSKSIIEVFSRFFSKSHVMMLRFFINLFKIIYIEFNYCMYLFNTHLVKYDVLTPKIALDLQKNLQ